MDIKFIELRKQSDNSKIRFAVHLIAVIEEVPSGSLITGAGFAFVVKENPRKVLDAIAEVVREPVERPESSLAGGRR